MSSTVWHRQFVFPGACFLPSNEAAISCVLEKTSCPSGTSYMSPREILLGMGNIEGSGPGQECMPDPGLHSTGAILAMIDKVPLGRCLVNNGKDSFCTSTEASCGGLPNQFHEQDPTCRLIDDLLVGSPLKSTRFGKCGDVCAWDSEYCTEGFTSAYALLESTNPDDECLCEDVRTGACYDGQDYYCAVSAKACDNDSQFVQRYALPDKVSCRLTESGLPRTVADKDGSSPSLGISGGGRGGGSGGIDKNTAVIVGGVVGGVLALALLVVVGVVCHKKRNKNKLSDQSTEEKYATAADTTSDAPTTTDEEKETTGTMT